MKPAEFETLWTSIEPFLPKEPPKPKGGRPRRSDKQALRGILFILETGIPWEKLPQEMGCGSGMTCWRRLRQWQKAGVWDRLHVVLLAQIHRAKRFAWRRFAIDSATVPSPRGGQETGPNPTGRGKSGTKRHLIVNSDGLPLVCLLSGAHRHDLKMLVPAVEALPALGGAPGRPRKRPHKMHADKGYDYPECRCFLRSRGIVPRIARRSVESSTRLGCHRWVVERTLSWLNRFRKLRIRYERCADAYLALCKFACCLICMRFVRRFC
ncbi:MAG: IS5 family transposase [Solidesulfovibrio sp.]|nr:IS5 family transposase [Solidesulfovibrio sp.]MEA5089600.1 IS5 family transposase [Solidesulfovibrio sp.]HML54555.1 IS5 family transposase [Solidesulfovibrio magneticus]